MPNPRGTARVTFLAHREIIETELREGWTAKAIFDRHSRKLAGNISYPQFTRYVRALRKPKEIAVVRPIADPERSAFDFDPNPRETAGKWRRPQ